MSQSLLRWGIENSDAEALKEQVKENKVKHFDPELIEHILGKDDAVQMKESVSLFLDTNKSKEERIASLDLLEMLVESIDNANNMEKIGLWIPLIQYIRNNKEDVDSLKMIMWIMATCAQNNPEAQNILFGHNVLDLMLEFLQNVFPSELQAKAIGVVSAMIRNNNIIYSSFTSKDGIALLERILEDCSDENLQNRIKFLQSTINEEIEK